MENMSEFNSDKREYFRINDAMFVEVSAISNAELEHRVTAISNPTSGAENAGQQLDELAISLTNTISQINQTDRETARALRLLDEKINIIANMIQNTQHSPSQKPLTSVNLSGGGIAFLAAESYSVKTPVEVFIELSTSAGHIRAIANVIACDELSGAPEETPYYLRLAFSYMSEQDRNSLVKHSLARQAQALRKSYD